MICKTDILQLEPEMLRISVDVIETIDIDIEKGKLLDVCETVTAYALAKRNNQCLCKPPHKILHICMSILKPIKTALKTVHNPEINITEGSVLFFDKTAITASILQWMPTATNRKILTKIKKVRRLLQMNKTLKRRMFSHSRQCFDSQFCGCQHSTCPATSQHTTIVCIKNIYGTVNINMGDVQNRSDILLIPSVLITLDSMCQGI